MRVSCVAPSLTYRKADRFAPCFDQRKKPWRPYMLTSSLLLIFICAVPIAAVIARASTPRGKTRLGCTGGEAAERQCSAASALTLKVER